MSAARLRVPRITRKRAAEIAVAQVKEGRRDFIKAGVGAVVGVIAAEILTDDPPPGDANAQVARAKAEAARAKAEAAEAKADNAELGEKIKKARKALKGEPT